MAGRIFVTGDCHGDFGRFSMPLFPEQSELDKNDYMIICGDFGGIWNSGQESKSERYWLEWINRKSYTTLFVDGNHENFDRLNDYPVRKWNGGKVHEIRPSIFHLMRGQVFSICGKRVFAFGGASSHDISGGILEADAPDFLSGKKRLDRLGAFYRINHFSWWREELASEQEMDEGKANLKRVDDKVDYIITHCCSTETQVILGGNGLYEADRETDYLSFIKNHVKFDKWFFGHYHMNGMVSNQEVLLYDQIIETG